MQKHVTKLSFCYTQKKGMIMEFSQIYSTVSGCYTEKKDSIGMIDEIVKNLEEFRNPNDVKEFLAEKYHLEEGKRKFYLSETVPVTVDESDKLLSIEINVANKHIIYNYRKGV